MGKEFEIDKDTLFRPSARKKENSKSNTAESSLQQTKNSNEEFNTNEFQINPNPNLPKLPKILDSREQTGSTIWEQDSVARISESKSARALRKQLLENRTANSAVSTDRLPFSSPQPKISFGSSIMLVVAGVASVVIAKILQKTIVENSPSRVTTPIVIPGLKTDKDFPWWPINLVPDNDKKKEKKKILELQIVGPFVLNSTVLLCRNDTNVEQGEVGKIIKIINFDRVLVDFTTPLVSKNFTKVQLKKLTFQTRSESVVLLNF